MNSSVVALHLIGVLRALVEVAGMALLAQGALFVICAGRHRQNPVYRLFALVTRPPIAAVRRVVPRVVGERNLHLLGFAILLLLWIVLAYVRLSLPG